jgi:pilus assembly protein CpaF
MTGVSALPRTLLDNVRARLVSDGVPPTAAVVAMALRAEGCVLGDEALLEAAEELHRELIGAGPLEPLLRDPLVTDVLVNGPDQVWVERCGQLVRTDVTFPDETAVRRLGQRLAAIAGRRLDDATPFVEARLPDGVRMHAVLPPVATRGTVISLRVPRRFGLDLATLVGGGLCPPEIGALLIEIVEHRLAFLVTGGTGTGKTTLLRALLGTVPHGERLVVVEDCAELWPEHEHVVTLEARAANQEGLGGVGMRELVRQALRMRPDRLVVGEARGAEVAELLSAMNTGHEGGCGTLHANRAEDVPARVEALALPAGLSRESVHSQLAAGIDCVIHLTRGGGGQRRLAEISVTCRDSSGLVRLVPAVFTGADGKTRQSIGHARLLELLGRPRRALGSVVA